jgi:hypothetical protein
MCVRLNRELNNQDFKIRINTGCFLLEGGETQNILLQIYHLSPSKLFTDLQFMRMRISVLFSVSIAGLGGL